MAARGQFSNRFGFIMAAAGSAVGLGNIWKFPFEAGNGGGAIFLFIYLFFCFVLCFPVMVTEIAIGRKTQRNPVGAFNALGFRKWNFIGKLGLLSGVLILSFYNVVAAWAFGYVFEMAMGNFAIGEHFPEYIQDIFKIGVYAIIFMVSTGLIISQGVSKGIEKATRILMPTLIVIILGLVIYSLTLNNSSAGLKFYLMPKLDGLNMRVISSALGQAFFSLSLGMGALITYGSYVSKKDNILTSASLITLMDVGIAFIAGLMMFPLVASIDGGNLSEVKGGPGLIFMTLPSVFEGMGGAGMVVGAVFFLLLSFAALTSTVSLLEVPVSYVVDEFGAKRKRAVWITAFIIFIVGIPSMISGGYNDFFSKSFSLLGTSDTDFLSAVAEISNILLLLGGFLITVFAAYVWRKNSLEEELSHGAPKFKGSLLSKYISFSVKYLCPVLLGAILFLTVAAKLFGYDALPDIYNLYIWIITACCSG